MAVSRPTYPIAEGIGIFIGIVALNLLAEGHLEIIRAALIAGACSLAWFGLRCWKTRNKQPMR
jgi:arginine exporter protein ArgO